MRGGGLWCPHQSPGAADMGRRVARRGAVAAPSGADDSADDGALGGTDDCALCAVTLLFCCVRGVFGHGHTCGLAACRGRGRVCPLAGPARMSLKAR